MTSIKITLTPQWIKANARAAEHAAKGLRARCIDHTHYEVPSATSATVYHQTVRSVSRLDVDCDCPAGRAGKTICWHKSAAVAQAIRHIREVEGQREQPTPQAQPLPAPVAAPAPKPAPRPVSVEEFVRRFAAA